MSAHAAIRPDSVGDAGSGPIRPTRGVCARLAASTRGAVYTEFLIAFFPLLLAFGALLQLAFLSAARLVVQHSAISAARAAIVVLPDDPALYGGAAVNSPEGSRLEEVRAAARLPLSFYEPNPDPTVSFPSGAGERDGLLRVRVEYDYPCTVPLGGSIACAGGGGKAKLSAQAAMPMQGAGYAY